MTSARKIRANRANARASSGPKTAAGKARSALNAFRHGFNVPIFLDPDSGERRRSPRAADRRQRRRRRCPGAGATHRRGADRSPPRALLPASADRTGDARSYVRGGRAGATRAGGGARRRGRQRFLVRRPADPNHSRRKCRPLWRRPSRSSIAPCAPRNRLWRRPPRTLAALDRYERRALSRRKFAIREFDLARLEAERRRPRHGRGALGRGGEGRLRRSPFVRCQP